MIARASTARTVQRIDRWTPIAVWCAVAAAAVATSFAAGVLAAHNHVVLLSGVLVLIVPVLASVRWTATLFGLVLTALDVEQYRIGAQGGDLTQQIPLFTSLSDGFKLSGFYVNPLEVLLGGILLVVIASYSRRSDRIPRSAVGTALAVFLAVVAFGAVHGLAAGGDTKMALWEMRPYFYIGIFLVLARRLPANVGTITTFLWVLVLAVALRTAEGLLLLPAYLHANPRPDFLLSHEDSFFFVLFIVMVAALWLFGLRGRMRAVATVLLPFVLAVNLANNRRTSWLMLAVGLLVLGFLAWVRLPERRPTLTAVAVIVSLGAAVYLPAYWTHTGSLAGPAEAVRSAIDPSQRDSLSDIYRQLEDVNLSASARHSPVIGVGAGVPLAYVVPNVDLTTTDPFIHYVPHDGILYLWWRFGIVGVVAFWSFIGFAMLSACHLLRATDRHLAVFGSLCACAIVVYLVLGDLDMGLWWFRVAVFLGCLLGVLDVAHRADTEGRSKEAQANYSRHSVDDVQRVNRIAPAALRP